MKTHLSIIKSLLLLIIVLLSSCEDTPVHPNNSNLSTDDSRDYYDSNSPNYDGFLNDKPLVVELFYSDPEVNNLSITIEDPHAERISDTDGTFNHGAHIYNSNTSGNIFGSLSGATKMIFWTQQIQPSEGDYKILIENISSSSGIPNHAVHFLLNIRQGGEIVDFIEGSLRVGVYAHTIYRYQTTSF
jgi:hypothetical protein